MKGAQICPGDRGPAWGPLFAKKGENPSKKLFLKNPLIFIYMSYLRRNYSSKQITCAVKVADCHAFSFLPYMCKTLVSF